MKKSLGLLLILLLLTGCNSNDKKNDVGKQDETNSVEKETDDKTTSEKEEKPKEETKVESSKKEETAKDKNIYKSVKTGKENKYSYTYSTKDVCLKQGNNDHFELIDKGIDVMVYDCEEIVDSTGKHLWGLIFYNCADEKCIFYY